MTPYHPHYGLADETRLKILKDAEIYGVKQAAAINNVSTTTSRQQPSTIGVET